MIQRFETFVLSINRIYRAIQRIKSREMTELGLKGTHVMCLFQLSQRPEGLTAAQITALTLEDKAAVSRAVTRLGELGLVTWEEEVPRRYRAVLRLTPAGEGVAERMTVLIRQAVREGGRGLTQEQRENFYAALGLIADNLERLSTMEEKTHESRE